MVAVDTGRVNLNESIWEGNKKIIKLKGKRGALTNWHCAIEQAVPRTFYNVQFTG